jgi:hypothetical protein
MAVESSSESANRSIGRQFENRKLAAELLLPVLKLAFEIFVCQPVALPFGEVGVLHRQFPERRRLTIYIRFVESGHLVHQHAHGPTIRDDVVHREDQDVFFRVQSEQQGTYERTCFDIEWSLYILGCELHHLRLALFRRESLQIDNRYLERQLFGDELDGLVIDQFESRAQAFMSSDDFIDAPRERVSVEPAGETQRGRHVVGDAVWFELMQKPQTLLSE